MATFNINERGPEERALARDLLAALASGRDLTSLAIGEAFNDAGREKSPEDFGSLAAGAAAHLAVIARTILTVWAAETLGFDEGDDFDTQETRDLACELLQGIYRAIDRLT